MNNNNIDSLLEDKKGQLGKLQLEIVALEEFKNKNSKVKPKKQQMDFTSILLGYARDLNVCIIFLVSSIAAVSYLLAKYNIQNNWSMICLTITIVSGFIPVVLLIVKSINEMRQLSKQKEWFYLIVAMLLFGIFYLYFIMVCGLILKQKLIALDALI